MKNYILLSGGPDSAVLATELARRMNLTCLFINFGQPYLVNEIIASRKISESIGCNLEEIVVPSIGYYFIGKGEFEHIILREIIECTYGLAAAYVRYNGGDSLYHASIAEDAHDIPGLPMFLTSMQNSINYLPGGESFKILTPYIKTNKSDVFRIGAKLNVKFEDTWSCLMPGLIHCGSCRACNRRRLAFEHAGIHDPTEYSYRYEPNKQEQDRLNN